MSLRRLIEMESIIGGAAGISGGEFNRISSIANVSIRNIRYSPSQLKAAMEYSKRVFPGSRLFNRRIMDR